jgi:ABC-type uncharacterized transport system involved in gliding motility auxiliary subunit
MNEKTQPRNYSFIALIVAGIALIGTALLGIVRGLVAMQVFTVASIDNLNRAILVSIGVIILGLATYAILEPDRVRRTFTGRQARYGSNAIVMIIAFVLILIFGNAMAIANPLPLGDLTEDNANTLSPEMIGALKQLPQKVTATGFFAQNSTESAEKLLSNIKANSKGKFDYHFVNPDTDPQAALNAGVTGDGKILLQMGSLKEIVAFASEDEMLKGFLRLINPGSNTVYFLIGHGELDTEQGGDGSMTRARDALTNKNYTVKTLNLVSENKIPEDANVIVVAGPQKPLTDNEVKLLEDFLAKGGSLVVMEDPTAVTKFGDSPDPLADMLSKDWGIVLDNDIVIDLNSPQPSTAVSASYDGSHAITRNMNNLITYYPYTRSISLGQAVEGVTVTQLVQTNERSWGETDFASLSQGGQVGLGDGEVVGPLTLAVAAENSTTKGRVVVFGTANLAVDQIFDTSGNGDMFVNSVDWSAEQESLVNLTPKTPVERSFSPPSQIHWILILLTSVFIVPGLIVVGGVSTWLARRRQG